MDRMAFDVWIETQLAPCLAPGTAVILDNLSTHRSPRAAELLKARGCWLLPLPAYSPDLNPIEMAFAKLKTHLRRVGPEPSIPSSPPSATSALCLPPTNASTTSLMPDTLQIKGKML